MKILYDATDGKIHHAVPSKDEFYFSHSTNIPLTEMPVDELAPVNQDICRDLNRVVYKVDANGRGKYYIDTATGNLMEREGWAEKVEDIYGG